MQIIQEGGCKDPIHLQTCTEDHTSERCGGCQMNISRGKRQGGENVPGLFIYLEEESMKEKVEQVINEIRLLLQNDGGNIELIDVQEQEGVVKVKLLGACGSCPMSQFTLKRTVEARLKTQIPEIKEVIAV